MSPHRDTSLVGLRISLRLGSLNSIFCWWSSVILLHAQIFLNTLKNHRRSDLLLFSNMAKLRNVFSILKRVINCSISGILVRLWLCKCSFFLAYLPFWPASMTLSCISIRLNPVLRKLLLRNVTVERRILIKLCDLLMLTFSDRTFWYCLLILVTTNLGRSVRYSLRVWRPLFYMLGWESVLSLPLLILLLLLAAWFRIWLLRGVVSQVVIYWHPL